MRLYGNFLNCRGCIFVLAAQPLEASREIHFDYDETVSGASVYNYYRDYSPDIGRYIQSDPIGLTGGVNTYAYAMSSPLKLIDPKGLDVYTCYDLGTCYFEQPTECIHNPALCEPMTLPGNPVAACTVRKILIDQLGGIPADKIKDTIVEKITKRASQGLKQVCKLSVKIVSIVWDIRGAYVSYQECKECPSDKCPTE